MATDGRGCAKCELVFHVSCLDDEEVCPSCDETFVAQALHAAVEEHRLTAQVEKAGGEYERKLALGAIAVVAVIDVALFAMSEPFDPVSSRWWALMLAAIGLYFTVCSFRYRTFILYRLKVARAVRWYGESTAHFLYFLLGLATMSASLFIALGRTPF
jgi:hypothetical protein